MFPTESWFSALRIQLQPWNIPPSWEVKAWLAENAALDYPFLSQAAFRKRKKQNKKTAESSLRCSHSPVVNAACCIDEYEIRQEIMSCFFLLTSRKQSPVDTSAILN